MTLVARRFRDGGDASDGIGALGAMLGLLGETGDAVHLARRRGETTATGSGVALVTGTGTGTKAVPRASTPGVADRTTFNWGAMRRV